MTETIYGMHEWCPTEVMSSGWVLELVELQHGPEPHPGLTRPPDDRERLIRIQYSFGDGGQTLPDLVHAQGHVDRIVSLVSNTPWAHIWVMWNEPNLSVEGGWTPEYVARMYNRVRPLIHDIPGHELDQVLLPPIGPWNVESGMGWVEYFTLLISLCDDIDGFALHTYTRSADPGEITDDSLRMDPPWDMYHKSFLTYQDWMEAIPERYRDRPVYITEFDENDAWVNQNTGIVQAAYKEVDRWNKVEGNQPIRGLILYRWPPHDKYVIEGKEGVIEDFRLAQLEGYKWRQEGNMPEWEIRSQNRCEKGFHDQDGQGELTIPNETSVHWVEGPGDGNFDRVEADAKDAQLGHPEVFEGRFSAMLSWSHSTGQAALVSDPILVDPDKGVRGWCQFMYTADPGWAGGAQMGIAIGSEDSPFNSGQTEWPVEDNPFDYQGIWWGEWASTYVGTQPRQWVRLSTPEFAPGSAWVRFICRFNSDQAIPAQGHFDVMTVEVEKGGTVPPPVDPPVDPSPGSVLEKLGQIDAHVQAIGTLTGEIRNQLLNGAIRCIPLDTLG